MPLITNLANDKWVVFIKDDAFETLYAIYSKNFEANNFKRREYSVIWFRQIWKKLNYIAGLRNLPSVFVLNIENAYNHRKPLYGSIQFETKKFYSRLDGKYYNVLIIDSVNYIIPYTDIYGGSRVTLREKTIRLTESDLRRMIRECINEALHSLETKCG